MTPLIVALPYCNKDADLALNLLKWMGQLQTGGIVSHYPHTLLLAADDTVPRPKIEEIMAEARPLFPVVRTMLIPPRAGWAPNNMFLAVARQVKQQFRLPFLWLEPDCVPLCSGWLDLLADGYEDCPYKFMGALITQTDQPTLPQVHLTGCAIYPNDAIDFYAQMPDVANGTKAWDIAGADVVVPCTLNTKLIHHFWGTPEMPPIFVSLRTAESPKNHVTRDFVSKEAVLFHRSKDGGLIKLLREVRGLSLPPGPAPIPAPAPKPEPAPVPAPAPAPKPAAVQTTAQVMATAQVPPPAAFPVPRVTTLPISEPPRNVGSPQDD